MFKRIFPKFRFSDNTFIDGLERQPLKLKDAINALQTRLGFGEAVSFNPEAPAKFEDEVMATITHTRLQSMLATTPGAGKTFTYRSKASQTHYNLPVLEPGNIVKFK